MNGEEYNIMRDERPLDEAKQVNAASFSTVRQKLENNIRMAKMKQAEANRSIKEQERFIKENEDALEKLNKNKDLETIVNLLRS